jgi:hypothetical protein
VVPPPQRAHRARASPTAGLVQRVGDVEADPAAADDLDDRAWDEARRASVRHVGVTPLAADGGTPDAEQKDEPAADAGADRGGRPVEALVDTLNDARGTGVEDDAFGRSWVHPARPVGRLRRGRPARR